MPVHDVSSLAAALSRTSFMDVFQRLDHAVLESLWSEGDARSALEAMVGNPAASPDTRFLAAEILFAKVPGYPPPNAIENLAAIYADALRNAPKAMANPWGMPGMQDGQIAQHVLLLGNAAIPALRAQLDDARSVTFSGSKEATFGNSYHYRVKDIAAELIARIRTLPFIPDIDPAVRDGAIRKLATTLK
jgi:hypothetical protein